MVGFNGIKSPGLNMLIQTIYKSGHSQAVYYGFHVIAIIAIIIFTLIYCKNYQISKKKAVCIIVLGYILGYLCVLLLGWIRTGFKNFGSKNIVIGFCFFPFIVLLLAKIFKMDWKRIMDFATPTFPLFQCVSHFGCNFAGCCRGYPMEHGIWNPVYLKYLFPTQLLESLVSWIVFLICIFYAKKQNYEVTGKVYPLFLILFGTTRFFLEFLRDNKKIYSNISGFALWALLMVVVGVMWFVVEKNKSEPDKKK